MPHAINLQTFSPVSSPLTGYLTSISPSPGLGYLLFLLSSLSCPIHSIPFHTHTCLQSLQPWLWLPSFVPHIECHFSNGTKQNLLISPNPQAQWSGYSLPCLLQLPGLLLGYLLQPGLSCSNYPSLLLVRPCDAPPHLPSHLLLYPVVSLGLRSSMLFFSIMYLPHELCASHSLDQNVDWESLPEHVWGPSNSQWPLSSSWYLMWHQVRSFFFFTWPDIWLLLFGLLGSLWGFIR